MTCSKNKDRLEMHHSNGSPLAIQHVCNMTITTKDDSITPLMQIETVWHVSICTRMSLMSFFSNCTVTFMLMACTCSQLHKQTQLQINVMNTTISVCNFHLQLDITVCTADKYNYKSQTTLNCMTLITLC